MNLVRDFRHNSVQVGHFDISLFSVGELSLNFFIEIHGVQLGLYHGVCVCFCEGMCACTYWKTHVPNILFLLSHFQVWPILL